MGKSHYAVNFSNTDRTFRMDSDDGPVKPTGHKGTKSSWIVITLLLAKFLCTLTTFVLADIVTEPVVILLDPTELHSVGGSGSYGGFFGHWGLLLQTLAFIQLSSGLVFTVVQKPFKSSNPKNSLTCWNWMRIFRHAGISAVVQVLWLSGLQLCGAFRTILVASHYDFTMAGIFAAFFVVKFGPRLRGAVLFFIGIFIFLLFDYDSTPKPLHFVTSPTPGGTEKAEAVMSRTSAGILTLIVSLLFKLVFNAVSKSMAVDLGGSRRLHALSTLVSGFLLSLMVGIDLLSGANMGPLRSNIVALLFVVMVGIVPAFYVDNFAMKRMEVSKLARCGTMGSQLSALLLSLLWFSTEAPSVTSLFAFGLIFLGTFSLTHVSKQPSGGGSFVGYSSDGHPLFSFSNESAGAIETTASMRKEFLSWMVSLLKQIQDDGTSRKMFYFFLINITFTFVEFLCGTLSNSLGLISDAFHMLFDSSALLIGLTASVICRWSPTPNFPFGYGRVEILSGFINSLFLVVVACIVFLESFQRIFDPPALFDTHRLLPVSIIGLIVNLAGIFAFKSSSVDTHHNPNIKGVFLHIFADTIGSVGVIISSFVVHQWEASVVDPICSLGVSMLVMFSVWPLLKDTAQILLLTFPASLERNIQQVLLQVLAMEGVKGYKNPRFWTHAVDIYSGSLHVQVTDEANEQQAIRHINSLFSSIGFSHFVIQVEKDEFIAKKSKNLIDIDEDDENQDNVNAMKTANFVNNPVSNSHGFSNPKTSDMPRTFDIALV